MLHVISYILPRMFIAFPQSIITFVSENKNDIKK